MMRRSFSSDNVAKNVVTTEYFVIQHTTAQIFDLAGFDLRNVVGQLGGHSLSSNSSSTVPSPMPPQGGGPHHQTHSTSNNSNYYSYTNPATSTTIKVKSALKKATSSKRQRCCSCHRRRSTEDEKGRHSVNSYHHGHHQPQPSIMKSVRFDRRRPQTLELEPAYFAKRAEQWIFYHNKGHHNEGRRKKGRRKKRKRNFPPSTKKAKNFNFDSEDEDVDEDQEESNNGNDEYEEEERENLFYSDQDVEKRLKFGEGKNKDCLSDRNGDTKLRRATCVIGLISAAIFAMSFLLVAVTLYFSPQMERLIKVQRQFNSSSLLNSNFSSTVLPPASSKKTSQEDLTGDDLENLPANSKLFKGHRYRVSTTKTTNLPKEKEKYNQDKSAAQALKVPVVEALKVPPLVEALKVPVVAALKVAPSVEALKVPFSEDALLKVLSSETNKLDGRKRNRSSRKKRWRRRRRSHRKSTAKGF